MGSVTKEAVSHGPTALWLLKYHSIALSLRAKKDTMLTDQKCNWDMNRSQIKEHGSTSRGYFQTKTGPQGNQQVRTVVQESNCKLAKPENQKLATCCILYLFQEKVMLSHLALKIREWEITILLVLSCRFLIVILCSLAWHNLVSLIHKSA